jgi:PAS domain S-box-containing protein
MQEERPLYNSRNIKVWMEYLQKFHPETRLDAILKSAGFGLHEIEDQGHWFTQTQIDRFYDGVRNATADPQIARKAGRYIPFCHGLRYLNQLAQGFFNPQTAYRLMGKFAEFMSRGAAITTRKLGPCKVEIVAVPKPGVHEKPYQCENRTGLFEAIPQFFTGSLARIEHPECVHRGAGRCRYELTWKTSAAGRWQRVRNRVTAAGIALCLALSFVFSLPQWQAATLVILLVLLATWVTQLYLENGELTRSIQIQSGHAGNYMDQMDMQYEHAMLVQEIGQATAAILDEEDLCEAVVRAMEKRLDFDRGLIMLASENPSLLTFAAGYGYDAHLNREVREAEFNLTNPASKGIFVRAFRKQRPFLIDDFNTLAEDHSARSYRFARTLGAQALICVPIVYEKQSIGVLAVDNENSKRPLRQSDISLLSGIASQTAVGLINARAFKRLIGSEKKYRDLVENANSIILRRDAENKVTFFNEFAQRRFGYTEDEIIGKSIFGTILADTRETRKEFDVLIKALHTDPDTHIVKETRSELRTGESVWITWTHKPIMNNDGDILEILCIGNDITKLKRAQNEKKELETQLIRAQKMEALGTLAGGVAHDLNNILAGMVSYPELLMLQMPKDDPMRKAVEVIRRSGEKAAAIVQDLLTLARRGVAVNDVVNLNDVVAEYFNSPEHRKLQAVFPQVRFEVKTEPSLLNISVSAVHLAKTLMNLVNNAAEAMVGDGTVTVQTANRYVDKPIRGYDDVAKGDYSMLIVSDTGIGIPPEDRERIFEPFYTKKKMGRSGTGLGMAVVWGTVKDHNGYIDVNSRLGEGSAFTLFFPGTRQHRGGQAKAVTIDSIKGSGEQVVVVDDMTDQREVAQEMLQCLNYNVTTLGSGEAAVDYLRENDADLLVLDMIMDPGIDGLETYKQILRIRPNQKAIITSGFSETDTVRQTQRLGAGPYVKKPYSIETIGSAIRHTLES